MQKQTLRQQSRTTFAHSLRTARQLGNDNGESVCKLVEGLRKGDGEEAG